MIVDLMRNDLGRVCEPGTISVSSLATAHAHAGVWHLVSEVQGLLRPEVDDEALLCATFPPGSVTGAPKIAAMNVIAELESTAREAYTGAIGIASPYAGLELSVAIRTFEIAGTSIRLGVGGGVVADSDPEAEARELAVKAAPLFDALGAKLPARRQPGRAPPVRRLGPVPVPRPDRRGGVFETMLVDGGRASRIELHLARLRASVASLYDAELSASLADEIAAAAERVPGRARLRVSLQPSFRCAQRPSGRVGMAGLESSIDVSSLGLSAGVRMRAWTVPGGLGRHKWSDRRLLEAIEASLPGEPPLLVDADGQLLEASRANVFVLGPDGILRTPPDDGRILPGIARSLVLSRAGALGLDVSAARLVLDDLIRARGVVLTSALRCVPVLELDGRALHTDADLLALVQSAVTG
jgi:para-aminobenzoate synthetase/4-amino-4-deoxychorismate lyase